MTSALSQEAYERAVRYPYDVPATHFRFDPESGRCIEAKHARLRQSRVVAQQTDAIFYAMDVELDGERHHLPAVCPVISAGSNSAPQQLRRKFQGFVHDPIYALRCRVSGWIPVYSAHLSSYGAIAGCLQPWPGAYADLFVTLLSPASLARMHETETLGVHYNCSPLPQGIAQLSGEPAAFELFYYECLQGPLLSAAAAPIVMAAFEVADCPLPRLTEEQVLRTAMRTLYPGCTLEEALSRIIASAEHRGRATEQLASLRIDIPSAS